MIFSPRQSLALTASVLVASALVACGDSKVAQCNKLITVINKADAIAQGMNAKDEKPDPATIQAKMEEGATNFKGLATEVQEVQLVDEQLKGYQGRFVKVYQDLGETAEKTGKALKEAGTLQKGDSEKAAAIEADLDSITKASAQIGKDGQELQAEVNKYCGATK